MFLVTLLFAFFAVLVGLAFTFAGYKFMRILLPLWGFFAGLVLGASGVQGILGTSFLADAVGITVGLFVGLLFAALAYFFYSFAVILLGAQAGFVLGSGFILLIGFNEGLISWLVGFVLAVIFAFAFAILKMPKLILVVLSAFGGAMGVVYGLLVLFGQVDMGSGLASAKPFVDNSFLLGLFWFVLAVLGVASQYAQGKGTNWNEVYVYETAPKSDTKPEVSKEK